MVMINQTFRRLVLSILVFSWLLCSCASNADVIGTVQGAEWETVLVDGIEYINVNMADPEYDLYSAADRSEKLGIIKSGGNTLHVYAVQGDSEGNYLYVRWEQAGYFYIRRECVKE